MAILEAVRRMFKPNNEARDRDLAIVRDEPQRRQARDAAKAEWEEAVRLVNAGEKSRPFSVNAEAKLLSASVELNECTAARARLAAEHPDANYRARRMAAKQRIMDLCKERDKLRRSVEIDRADIERDASRIQRNRDAFRRESGGAGYPVAKFQAEIDRDQRQLDAGREHLADDEQRLKTLHADIADAQADLQRINDDAIDAGS